MSKPPPLPDTATKNNRMSVRSAAVIFTVLAVIFSYILLIDQPHRNEETRLFQELKPGEVTSIKFNGVYSKHSDLAKAPFSIQDAGQIQMLCQAMREARSFYPSHPVGDWYCKISFVTAARTWEAQITSTRKYNGVLIDLEGGNTLRNDSLGPMLEKIVKDHEQTHPELNRP